MNKGQSKHSKCHTTKHSSSDSNRHSNVETFFLKCWSSMLDARENVSNIMQHEKKLKKCWINV